MKKYLLAFCFLLLLLLSCATSGKKVLLAERAPIALVSFVSNMDINWKGEDSIPASAAARMTRRIPGRDPDLTVVSSAKDLVVKAEQIFREELKSSKIITLAEREKVLYSRAYGKAKLNVLQEARERKNDLCRPAGFRLADYRDKGFAASLAEETGIECSMYVDLNFIKRMASGVGKFGTLRAQLDMLVKIYDKTGKKLFEKSYSVSSNERIKVSNSVYSQSELFSLFESAITDACYDFLEDFEG